MSGSLYGLKADPYGSHSLILRFLPAGGGLHGRWLSALHALNALSARCWQGLFAYQFVAVARREGAR